MKWTAQFEADEFRVTISATGDVGRDGFCGCIAKLISHPSWRPGMSVLCDFRSLNIGSLTKEDIKHLVEIDQEFFELTKEAPSLIGVVVARELDYGLVRMWELYANEMHPGHNVFLEVKDALQWLRAGAQKRTDVSKYRQSSRSAY